MHCDGPTGLPLHDESGLAVVASISPCIAAAILAYIPSTSSFYTFYTFYTFYICSPFAIEAFRPNRPAGQQRTANRFIPLSQVSESYFKMPASDELVRVAC